MELTIEKLVFGGDGLGFVDGCAVMVPFTAPGDRVSVEPLKRTKGLVRARILEVIEPASCRTQPLCPYFGECGGCQWQHVNYSAQLLWKQAIVEEQLQRIAKIREPDVLPCIPSPQIWRYRNRIKLHIGNGKIGFFKAGSHDVVDIADCIIADQRINISDARRSLPKDANEIELGVKDVNGFSQVNTEQNEQMIKLVGGQVEKGASVLELYCGDGNLTRSYAARAKSVDAVDTDRKLIDAAKKLSLNNVNFAAMDAVAFTAMQVKEGKKFDCVLLDPPREGAAAMIPHLKKLEAKQIVYVSCDPATLSRDIKELSAAGYKLGPVQPLDMFPQTYHVEMIAILQL